MPETLTMTSLGDAPLEGNKPPEQSLQASRHEKLAQFVSGILVSADREGFATTRYGDIKEGVAQIMGCSPADVDDAPWLMRAWLEQAGAIMAPDPALERRRLKDTDAAVVYLSACSAPSLRLRPYKKALLLAKYLTLAFQPLDSEELAIAGQYIDRWVKDERYRLHLRALLRWYNVRRRLLDKRTRLMHHEIMKEPDRQAMAAQVAEMAARRGADLDRRAMAKLERVLKHLGIDENPSVLLHRMQTSGQDIAKSGGAPTTAIDARLLERIERQTMEARALLADVLDSQEGEITAGRVIDEVALLGKDTRFPERASAYCSLESQSERDEDWRREAALRLMEREEWTLGEVGSMMPGRPPLLALEEINNMAIDIVGDTIADVEGERVYITKYEL